MSRVSRLPFATGALVLGIWASAAAWADWPQILGQGRDGVASEGERLDAKWPRALKPLWSAEAGEGYSGPVVSGNRAFLFHRVGDENVLESLELVSGKRVWRAAFPATYGGGVNSDRGPRCTPVVSGGRVFVMSAAGVLAVYDERTGREQWRRNLSRDYRASDGYFGAGSSPLVVGKRVLVNVGGRAADSGIVALEVENGKTTWTSTDAGASYSSPTLAQFDGQPCAIFVTRLTAIGVSPDSGDVLFQFRFGSPGPTVNGATPLVFNDRLFLSASYGVGARLVELRGNAPAIWRSRGDLDSQYATAVHYDGFLYGSHGREDVGEPALRCVDAKNGKVQWSQPLGVAHVIRVGKELLVLEVPTGRLLQVACDPRGYRLLSETQVANGLCRALPALSDGRLLVRVSSPSGGQLRCLKVGPPR